MSKNITPGVPGQDPTSIDNTNPAVEPDLLEEIAKVDASVIEAMPRVERAAFRRELLSAIRRATWAAERLADIDDEENATEPGEDEEEPLTEPGRLTPALALRSDGTVLLSPEYLDKESLKGREVWSGVVLSLAESCDALDAMNDAACDAAAHIGGRLIRLAKKKAKDEGGNGDE